MYYFDQHSETDVDPLEFQKNDLNYTHDD